MEQGELWKRISEAAKRAAGGNAEQPVQQPGIDGTPSPEEAPKKASSAGILEVAKEKLAEMAKKLAEGAPESAKRIIGSEADLPTDARVFSVVESLLLVDEAQLSDPTFMRGIGEKLVAIIEDTGAGSPAGAEAKKFLHRIVSEHQSLSDLERRAMAPISPEENAPLDQDEVSNGMEEKDPQLVEEVGRLFDKNTDADLSATPLAQDLSDLQYRFKVDPGAAYDNRLTDDAVRRMVEKGRKEGVSPELVQKAVERVREFERFTDLRMQKHQEKLRGGRVVSWREIRDTVPNPDLHGDDDVFPDFRYIPASEVETIIHGDGGEAEWYFNFIDQIYSLGREETRPTLTQDQRFQEFKDYLTWKYGGEYHLAVQLYQKHWDSRGQYEYAVKGLMYNPGDVKDRLKAMSLLQGADLDHLYKNFDHSNEAYSLYEHVMFELMAEKRARYGKAIEHLREEIDWNGKRMKREDVLKTMKAKLKEEGYDPEKGKTQTSLTVADQRLMFEIQREMDLASEGVMLWDDDVQSFTELHITLSKLRTSREELLKKKSRGVELTEPEADKLHEVERLYQIYSHREEMLNENFTQELIQTRGLSPVDIEVRKRLVEYMRAQTGKEPAEYEVRMALWAARTAMIGSGRMAMIGAMMSVPPSIEYHANSGKDVMRAPAFEDLQRIFNPEVFASRFNIGGELGVTARGILRKNLLRTKGITEKDPAWYKKISGTLEHLGHKFKLTKTKEWKQEHAHSHDKMQQAAMDAWEFAEDATGISFSELLGPGFMSSGGFYDGTAWRLEKGIADELRNKMLDMKKLPENAALLDNQALSIQLLTAGNASERRPILDRMLRRNPSKFLELLTEDTEKILHKHGVTREDWKKFKEALSLAELKMSHNKEWQFARVDLGEKKDFDALVTPFLSMLHIDAARAETFRTVLTDLQAEVYRSRKVEASGAVFRNKMDAIAQLKLPLTLSLTDMDWKESNFYQLGTVAMHRRIRDVGAQMRARDAMLEFMSNSEMLMSPNEPVESIKKLMDIRTAIIDYSGPEAAENTVKEMARVLLEMNRHRSLWTVGMIPGATSLATAFAEVDMRPLKDSWATLPIRLIVGRDKWKKFVDQKLTHLPHSVAEQISYSRKFTGAHGNAWDEKKIEEVLVTMHDMGMFIHHPEYIQDLRREFHAKLGDRLLAMVRTYWWVAILATIAIAAEQGLEERKAGGGGGHH